MNLFFTRIKKLFGSQEPSLVIPKIRASASTGAEVRDALIKLENFDTDDPEMIKSNRNWIEVTRLYEVEKPFQIINLLVDGVDEEIEGLVRTNISKVKTFHCTFSKFKYVRDPELGIAIEPQHRPTERVAEFYLIGCSFTEFEYFICGIEYSEEAAYVAKQTLVEKILKLSHEDRTRNWGNLDFNELKLGDGIVPLDLTASKDDFNGIRWRFREECYQNMNVEDIHKEMKDVAALARRAVPDTKH